MQSSAQEGGPVRYLLSSLKFAGVVGVLSPFLGDGWFIRTVAAEGGADEPMILKGENFLCIMIQI